MEDEFTFLKNFRTEFNRPPKETITKLKEVSCATAWSILNLLADNKGDDFFMEHLRPLSNSMSCVGPALTIRYRPYDPTKRKRGDTSDPTFTQQRRDYHATLNVAWHSIKEGDIIVAEGYGYNDVGQFGDCLASCFQTKGAAGIITDASVRDGPYYLELDYPTFTGGPTVPGALTHVSRDGTSRGLIAVDVNVPIMCDGVPVRPGDIMLGNMDGVIVIPIELADKVAEWGQAREKLEELSRKLAFDGKPIEDSYMPLVKWIKKYGYEKWLDIITKYDGGEYARRHGEDYKKLGA
jgi:regulator of RNase E activity RraA